jgi:transcriptional regulator with XRE-family HTH domain
MELRKLKGLSQDELAKRIGMSRPSLAQAELGKRSIDAIELYTLSVTLGFSLDEFLSPGSGPVVEILQEKQAPYHKKEEVRISVPELRIEKFKTVLLYILGQCAGKPNIGETALNKLLYFCDFNYYELYEEHLTGARYRKLPYGPVPTMGDSIISQMVDQGLLKRIKTDYHGLSQTRYIPLERPDLSRLSAAEKTVIDQVLHQMSDWNAGRISDYSHHDIPWMATPEGTFISYNLVFYRELPYSVRMYPDDNH